MGIACLSTVHVTTQSAAEWYLRILSESMPAASLFKPEVSSRLHWVALSGTRTVDLLADGEVGNVVPLEQARVQWGLQLLVALLARAFERRRGLDQRP
jgi:hypothetical protein